MPHNDSHAPRRPIVSRQSQTVALMVCMSIAALLWLANKLAHEYKGEIMIQLLFTQVPDDYVLCHTQEDKFIVQVKTKGTHLLWHKLGRKKLIVEIPAQKLSPGKNILPAARLLPDISAYIPKEYEVLAVMPDTFHYCLEKKITKKVPIAIVTDITYHEQFGLAGPIELRPAEVVLSGPKSEISSVKEWETESIIYSRLNQSVSGTVKLKSPAHAYIHLDPAEVSYHIPVEEYTGHEVEVELTPAYLPSRLQLTLYPKRVKITFQVALKDFEKVKPHLFKAVADFSSHQWGKDKYVEVKVVQAPDFVRYVRTTPSKVEYIIHKNEK